MKTIKKVLVLVVILLVVSVQVNAQAGPSSISPYGPEVVVTIPVIPPNTTPPQTSPYGPEEGNPDPEEEIPVVPPPVTPPPTTSPYGPEEGNPEVDEPTSNGGGSGGSGGSGSSSSDNDESEGEVLGATTEDSNYCAYYIVSYMQEGQQNDYSEVVKLQTFLNEQGIVVPVTGFFGPLTDAAVKQFQQRHREIILDPWVALGFYNTENPTGYVYKTTQYMINNIKCPGQIPYPELP